MSVLHRLLLRRLAGAGLIVCTALFAPRAVAHAVLLGSEPADGAVLAAAPAVLELRFNEPVTPLVLRVLDARGAPLAGLATDTPAATTLRVPLPAVGDGAYLASWRVASADAHPVAGSLVWRVGTDGDAAPTVVPALADADVSPPLMLRIVCELALLLAAGLALALPWLRPEGAADARSRVLLRTLAWLGLALLLPRLLAEGAALAGTRDGFADAALAALLRTAYPLAAAVAAAGLLLLALAPPAGPAGHRRTLAGAALTLASLGLTGHAAHAGPVWLLGPALLGHAACAALWLAALGPTAFVLRRDAAADRDAGSRRAALVVLGRFAHRGRELLGGLAATGLLLAFVQLGPPSAAWTGDYGRLFAAKLALAVGLFGLGALNRWRWLPALARGDAVAGDRLRASVGTSRLLLAVVVALSVALGTTVPPRALAVASSPLPLLEHPWRSDYGPVLTLSVALVHGRPAAALRASAPDGTPLALGEVSLLLERSEAGIEPLRRPLGARGPGLYANDDLLLPLAGRWHGQVEVWIDDFTLDRQPVSFDLP